MREALSRPLVPPLFVLLVAVVASTATVDSSSARRGAVSASCPTGVLPRSYTERIAGAVASGRDVWGEAELRAPGGPSLSAARRYLRPLLFAGHVPGRRTVSLTDSGVYYLPFAVPESAAAPGQVALHLADGSEIVAGSVDGRRLRIGVGAAGAERFGSCLARLSTPSLYGGYLPVLETRYRDVAGASYRQESFAARVPQTGSLVSFVRIAADARRASKAVEIRFTVSDPGLRTSGGRLVRGGDAVLLYGSGAHAVASSVVYEIPRGSTRTVYVAWLYTPASVRPLSLDAAAYLEARARLVDYWQGRLSSGASLEVPEKQVTDAERATLIQNLVMGWRYSIGNPYQEFEYPESLDGASVMGEYGFGETERTTLDASLAHRPSLYPDWEMGSNLLTVSGYVRLFRDRAFLAAATPTLRGYVARLATQLDESRYGMLKQERWASDLTERAYALDNQAVVWQGLRAIAGVWANTQSPALAQRARTLAHRLGAGLQTAIRNSQRLLPDRSLYLPVRLYTDEQAPGYVLKNRAGSYWNLVVPYVLASGLLPPDSPQATAVLRYLERHGSLLLGQVRVNGYSLASGAQVPAGTDDVYLLDLARFLADNHQAGRLDVALYGQLATGMTPGTYVSGETATITPTGGRVDRSMYLPPNSVANAAFLETLRLTLIHQLTRSDGTPDGLELAYATPRSWLAPGRTITVHNAPTSFGRLSYSITAQAQRVRVTLLVPPGSNLHILRLRLRLPGGQPITHVELNGTPCRRGDRATDTIDLSGDHGPLNLTANF
jgi:hypothetical protein